MAEFIGICMEILAHLAQLTQINTNVPRSNSHKECETKVCFMFGVNTALDWQKQETKTSSHYFPVLCMWGWYDMNINVVLCSVLETYVLCYFELCGLCE